MKTWRQLTANEQQEARDWWETSEAVFAPMSDTEKLCSIFKERPEAPPWPQPPFDLRTVKPEEIEDHDWSSVLVPDDAYDLLEQHDGKSEYHTNEEKERFETALYEMISRFTGVPARHFSIQFPFREDRVVEVFLVIEREEISCPICGKPLPIPVDGHCPTCNPRKEVLR